MNTKPFKYTSRLKQLKIGEKTATLPIIQGGMGVGISRSSLAGAVAKEGGVGVISTAQIGYDEEGFEKDQAACNRNAIQKHIRKAKEIAQGSGLIAVNIMVALKHYEEHVKESVKAGADAIISGAGLPMELPAMVPEESGTNIEHLNYDEEIRNIIECKKEYEDKFQKKIPVIVAGGIFDRTDIDHAIELGADGVQIASRFVATEECDASEAYKQAYIKAEEKDIRIIQSPVGMPGRALENDFIRAVEKGRQPVKKCYNCLHKCNPKEVPYCITKALIDAVKGDVQNGLIFCGANVGQIKEMTTVPELMRELAEA